MEDLKKSSTGIVDGSDEQETKQAKQYKKMTQTPIPRLIVGLGIPTTISMFITGIYNVADTYFVGRYGAGIGSDEAARVSAQGAIGVIFALMSIIQAFGFMYGQGAGSVSSRALGSKDVDRASRYSSTGFFDSFITGALITVFGLIFITPLATLLGSTDTILPYAKAYASYILFAAPFMCSSCVLNNVLRYEGKAIFAMVGLATGGILNIFGDYYLMKILGWGVRGAGISTAVSQTISFLILLSMFLRGKTSAKLRFKNFSRDFKDSLLICRTGFPSLVRQGLNSVSVMALNFCAKPYGDPAITAMANVNRICFFTFAAALGIGQGFQPVSAFNYGAKKYKRVKQAFFFTFAVGEVLLGTVALVGCHFTGTLIGYLSDAEDVIKIGAFALGAHFIGQIFQPFAVCTNMMFQSIGKTTIATIMSMLRSGLFFIPVLFLLSNTLGLTGIQIAQPVADVLTTLVSIPFALKFIHTLTELDKEVNS